MGILESIISAFNPVISPLPDKPDYSAYWGPTPTASVSRPKVQQRPDAIKTKQPTPFQSTMPQEQVSPSVTPYLGNKDIPPEISRAIYSAFDKYGEATNAAQVLQHPMQVSGTPQEIKQGYNWWGNRGENPSFNPQAENKNADGSIDRGLFQINSNTFNGMMNDPFWKSAMERRGITHFDQMFDPQKNAVMALLILMRSNFNAQSGTMMNNPNYSSWFGAPQALRLRQPQ